jgi:plasmid stabilization system protein ParE
MIYYRFDSVLAVIEIVRVLHERMDVEKHLH